MMKPALKTASRHLVASLFALTVFTGPLLAQSAASQLEKTWYAAGDRPVADKALPTITLEKGNVTGTDSCNNLIGGYKLRGKSRIRFQVGSTMMACPDMTEADAFQSALSRARRYEVKGGMLILRDANGKQIIRLTSLNK